MTPEDKSTEERALEEVAQRDEAENVDDLELSDLAAQEVKGGKGAVCNRQPPCTTL
jgi:hypothetical protein